MRITRKLGAIIAISALFLSACDAEDEPQPDGTAETEGNDSAEDDQSDSDADGSVEENEGSDGPGEDVPGGESTDNAAPDNSDFTSPLACDTPFDGPESDLDTYEEAYLEANFQLEELVSEFGQEFEEYSTGDSDGFVARMEEISHSYGEIIAGPIELGPPEQAAQWHANTVESWVRICETFANAHEGAVTDDDAKIAAVEEALTEHPSLLNDLHANTMIGPGENA